MESEEVRRVVMWKKLVSDAIRVSMRYEHSKPYIMARGVAVGVAGSSVHVIATSSEVLIQGRDLVVASMHALMNELIDTFSSLVEAFREYPGNTLGYAAVRRLDRIIEMIEGQPVDHTRYPTEEEMITRLSEEMSEISVWLDRLLTTAEKIIELDRIIDTVKNMLKNM